MARKIEIQITGDSSGAKAAFDDTGRAAQGLNQKLRGTTEELRQLGRTGGARYWKQVAAGAVGGGAAVFAFSRAIQGAAAASAAFTGENSQLTQGLEDSGSALQSLVTLDFAGFINATQNASERARAGFEKYNTELKDVNQSTRALEVATVAAALGHEAAAAKIRDHVAALQSAQTATDAAAFAQREWNATVIDGANALVAFKGARDSLGLPMGPGGVAMEPPGTPRPGLPTLPAMSPSQRRELALVTAEDADRIPLLKDRLAQLNAQLADFNGNQEQRLRLATQAKATERELTGIYESQAAAQRAAAAAQRAAWAAEAAKWQRIREGRREAEQARQLGVLQRPIPTPTNLRRQLEQIQGRISEGETVPKWMRDILFRIPDELKKATPETRAAIRDYLAMVRGEFKKGARTPTMSLNANNVLGGLGLTPQQLGRARARLAGFNAGGKAFAGGGTGAYGMVVDVYLDGDKVGGSVKRFGQRDKTNSPRQKRGPNAGR